MPRSKRIVIPYCPHHVVHRGNGGQDLFVEEGDHEYYLDLLADACFSHEMGVLGYCLMPNHVHLVLVPTCAPGLSDAIRAAHGAYARALNGRESRTGHLFEGRFYSVALDESHLAAALWYVENNPVRARLARRATDFPWSSARGRLLGAEDPLLLVHGDLGLEEPAGWRDDRPPRDPRQIETMRSHTVAGRPLGDARSWLTDSRPEP